jgi:GT2 family glycosyltransferase
MAKKLVSVITPIYNPDLGQLRECLDSVGRSDQVEHILGLDGPDAIPDTQAFNQLANEFGVKVAMLPIHGGIAAATNCAVIEATGEMLLFLDQDDFLMSGWADEVLPDCGSFDLIYSDRHSATEQGELIETQIFSKPDWSPFRLLGNMYLSHFFAVKRNLFLELGGMRTDFDGSQDHDLAIRVSETNPRVKHIDVPLYAWRQSQGSTALNPASKSYAPEAGVNSVNEHHKRANTGLVTQQHPSYPGFYVHKYPQRTSPISVVIPSGFGMHTNNKPVLRLAIQSIVTQLHHPDDEVILVSAGENDFGVLDEISKMLTCSLTHVIDDQPFNFSRRVNLGALQSRNEMLMFLNDDVELSDETSIDALSYVASQSGVGAAGIQLRFPDGRLQHAGHSYYDLGAHHPFYLTRDYAQHFGDLILDREVAGVTAACLVQRKDVWKQVGGFTSELPSNYNDVDFCLKIREAGHSIIVLNSIWGTHYESTTRDPSLKDWEVKFIRNRWTHRMWRDRFTVIREQFN